MPRLLNDLSHNCAKKAVRSVRIKQAKRAYLLTPFTPDRVLLGELRVVVSRLIRS